MQALAAEFGGAVRESSFLHNPLVPPAALEGPTLPPFHIAAGTEWDTVPPPAGATVLRPAAPAEGATDAELLRWFTPHAHVPILELGDMAGRLDATARAADAPSPAPSESRPLESGARARVGSAPSESGPLEGFDARLARGVRFREEITRHVRQQVRAAAPFDCLCVQHEGVLLPQNLSGVVTPRW